MITIRWTSFVVGMTTAACVYFSPRGEWVTFFLALLMTAATVTFLWTWRGTEWVRDIPSDHPDTIRSLARRDRAAQRHYQETHR